MAPRGMARTTACSAQHPWHAANHSIPDTTMPNPASSRAEHNET